MLLAAICALAMTVAIGGAVHAQDATFQAAMDGLARSWAHVNYEIKDPRAEASEAQALGAKAGDLAKAYPNRAEPLAWQALIQLSEADARHNMHSLELVRSAKRLLDKAAKIDPNAIGQGSIYANIGALYAQVPSFPLGFGDATKARGYFQKAVMANPNGLDANYFYGDFLYREGDRAGALKALERALAAPARPGRELADRGRKWEAAELMSKIHRKDKLRDGQFADAGENPKP